MSKELLEFIINRVSYLTINPEHGGDWANLCYNVGSVACKKCQQEQCDSAGGGIPKPSEYKWIIKKKGTESERSEEQ